jgi:hypothetical protein
MTFDHLARHFLAGLLIASLGASAAAAAEKKKEGKAMACYPSATDCKAGAPKPAQASGCSGSNCNVVRSGGNAGGNTLPKNLTAGGLAAPKQDIQVNAPAQARQ